MMAQSSSGFSERFSEDQLLYMAAGVYTLGAVSNVLLGIFLTALDKGFIPLSNLIALLMLLIVIPTLFMSRVWLHRRWGLLDGIDYHYYLDVTWLLIAFITSLPVTWLLIAFITSLPGIPFRFIATGFLMGMRHGFVDESSETGARLAVVTCLLLLAAPMLGLLGYVIFLIGGVQGELLSAMRLFVDELTRSALFLLVFILIPIKFLEGRRIYDWNQGLFFLVVAMTVLWLLFSPFGYLPLLSLP